MFVPKALYSAQGMYEYIPKDIYASWRNPAVALPRRLLNLLTVALSVTLPVSIFWFLLSHDHLPHLLSKGPVMTITTHWHGWANVEKIFVFGDSYTETGFKPNKEQPSPSNPFGNPPLPKSSSVHQKWIHYLTTTYNSSAIQTYNMAGFGHKIDAFVGRYHHEFLPRYGTANHTLAAGWNSTNSLFATFYGINDVRSCTDQPLMKDDCGSYFRSLFTIYGFLLDQLYTNGARNFLILNIPPLDRMPFSRQWGHPVPPRAVSDWNTGLASLASNFSLKHPDATVFQFDTHALFNEVMDDPKSHPQTAIYQNTLDVCGKYEKQGDKTAFNKGCDFPLEKYLWHDALHPTPAVHDAMAAQIAQMLERWNAEDGG